MKKALIVCCNSNFAPRKVVKLRFVIGPHLGDVIGLKNLLEMHHVFFGFSHHSIVYFYFTLYFLFVIIVYHQILYVLG